MKILVTGDVGFIGSCVIRHIIDNSADNVINLDKLTYAGNLESLSSIDKSSRCSFEHVDICNEKELKRVFHEHKPTAVMHLAAESHVDRSINGPISFIKSNIAGTYTLLEVCREYYGHLDKNTQKNSVPTMCQLMKYTETLAIAMNFSQKQHHIRLAHLILPARQAQISRKGVAS